MSEAIYIEEALIEMADERQAQQLLRFFKTSPGGEGDVEVNTYFRSYEIGPQSLA